MSKFDFSLILPCYNEGEIFVDSLARIIEVLDETSYTWEIIFIDDKSKDKTKKLIKEALKKYPRKNLRAFFHWKNKGRGKTVVEGFLKAHGKMVGFIDVDLEIGEWYLSKFIQTIEKGADVAIAWRIYDFRLATLARWISSKGYILLRKIFLGLPFKDTEAGYKFFRKKTSKKIFENSVYPAWFWDTEIMARAYRAKLEVREIPVAFVRRFDKTSTVRLIPDSFRYLRNLISFRFNL